ncbi:MAG: hypothetical protein O2779_00770 [Nanoarchaeota archaeon]|nr:hypothetical protein [Nanoarchaeota archaeon]
MIKKVAIISIILTLFLATGCETINQLYGLEPASDAEFISLEDIKVEDDLPPPLPVDVDEEPPAPPEDISEEEVTKEPVTPVEVVTPEPVVTQPSNAKILIVQETDLVSLKPRVDDPDQDSIALSYTSPISQAGAWQTTYGDEGEYTITITASDGELTAAKDVLVIVNKKEESPVIASTTPTLTAVSAVEDSSLEFTVVASDLNNDPLAYSWRLNGEELSTNKESFSLPLDFSTAGEHSLEVIISDSVSEVRHSWEITVANLNRQPTLETIADITLSETELVILSPSASDADGDEIQFTIDDERFSQDGKNFVWETNHDDSGSYTVTIHASDGTDEISQEVTILVENVNRPPVIEDITLG